MHCSLICLLASAMSVGSFACALPMNVRSMQELRLLMTDQQNTILDQVVAERSRLAFEGLFLGLLMALPLVWFQQALCLGTMVLFITQSTYYTISKKHTWMLTHLDTREQVQQWLIIYRSMQFTGIMSSVIAALVYICVAFVMYRLRQK